MHRFTIKTLPSISRQKTLHYQRGYATSSHYMENTRRSTPFSFRKSLLKIHPLARSQLRGASFQKGRASTAYRAPNGRVQYRRVAATIKVTQFFPRWALLQVNWFTPFAQTAFEYEPSIYREQGSRFRPESLLRVHRLPRSALSLLQRNIPSKRKDSPFITMALAGVTTKLRKNDFSLGEVVGLLKSIRKYLCLAHFSSFEV